MRSNFFSYKVYLLGLVRVVVFFSRGVVSGGGVVGDGVWLVWICGCDGCFGGGGYVALGREPSEAMKPNKGMCAASVRTVAWSSVVSPETSVAGRRKGRWQRAMDGGGGVGDGGERELEGSFGVCGERREADWVVGDGEHINNWAATSQLGLHRAFGGESGHSLVQYFCRVLRNSALICVNSA
ncbi:hypothetical protein FPQ18DRAFT_133838 [Pyronema domesticum]|nr:hypothetical protein FPQ18DRAFT_133838 [Pyronema domesticum]